MLLDANSDVEVQAELTADIVIVGAGTVGLYLASALAEARPDANIIIIEAGPRVASTALNSTTAISVGRSHAGVSLGRAAGLGGTSTLWGGQLAEFEPWDMERADAPWPISYPELARHYATVYQRLGIGSPAGDAVYRQKLGGETAQVESIQRFFTHWLPQPNFAAVYRAMILARNAVRVVVNLTANGCMFDGDVARMLRCVSASGRRVSIYGRRVVFAAGTIATNRFFLSTQRAGQVPWADNGQVGCYFQDHLGGRIATASVHDERKFRDYFENGWVGGKKLQPKLTLSHAARQSLPSGACGMFSFDSSIAENIGDLKKTIRGIRSGLSFSSATSGVHDLIAVGGSALPIAVRYLRDRRIFALFDRGVAFNVQAEQVPIARSTIRLQDGGTAADGLVPVVVHWHCDGCEIDSIHRLAVEADAYLRRHGLAQLEINQGLLNRDPAFLDRLGDTNHPCGGMRMSATANTGVVDPNCRVWESANVWVTGATVFPSSSHANCTLTALALATRLVPKLAQ
ncbi:MAG TPA: GMC oxidoreductase [Candidatus Binataceae bacterium]|nr:GMC oxidoreductase [Candidatus Binataceae bacterium]